MEVIAQSGLLPMMLLGVHLQADSRGTWPHSQRGHWFLECRSAR